MYLANNQINSFSQNNYYCSQNFLITSKNKFNNVYSLFDSKTKKNFYEMKRNIVSTLIEILFPIIVVLLLYALKKIYDIENKEFSVQEGSIQNFTKMRSVYNLDTFDILNISI